jgi:hypothetical protein
MQPSQSSRPPAPQPQDTPAETLRALQRGEDIATVSTGTGLLIEATPVDPTQVYDVRISELRGDGTRDLLLGARIPAAGALPALDALLDPALPDLVLTRTDRAALTEQVHQLRAALDEATHTVVPAEIAARMNSAPERGDSPVRRDGVAGAEPGTTDTGPAPPNHRALTIEDAVAELAARRRPGLLSVHQAAHEALAAREAAHRRAARLTLARLDALAEAGQAEHEAARRVPAQSPRRCTRRSRGP